MKCPVTINRLKNLLSRVARALNKSNWPTPGSWYLKEQGKEVALYEVLGEKPFPIKLACTKREMDSFLEGLLCGIHETRGVSAKRKTKHLKAQDETLPGSGRESPHVKRALMSPPG